MTVGELIDKLKEFDDDIKVITVSNNFELRGHMVEAKLFKTKCSKSKKEFKDGFDGIEYRSEIYESSQNGEDCIRIYG